MTIQPSIRAERVRGTAIQVLRSVATSRPGLIAIAGLVIGSGLALNWASLVAVGAASLILGILPCAAMCAVGLCMPMGGSKKEGPIIEITANPIRRDHDTLVIEAAARTQTAPPTATFKSLPNP